jgi:hypothetical protein
MFNRERFCGREGERRPSDPRRRRRRLTGRLPAAEKKARGRAERRAGLVSFCLNSLFRPLTQGADKKIRLLPPRPGRKKRGYCPARQPGAIAKLLFICNTEKINLKHFVFKYKQFAGCAEKLKTARGDMNGCFRRQAAISNLEYSNIQ